MQYLLDTHVLIWWITSDNRLSAAAKALIQSRRNTLYWSAASSWEVSIKHALGRLVFDEAPEKLFASELQRGTAPWRFSIPGNMTQAWIPAFRERR